MPKRRRVPLPKKTVALTDPHWRAVAAMLWVAANVTATNLEQRTLFLTIYDEVARQINFVPKPIEAQEDYEEESEEDPGGSK